MHILLVGDRIIPAISYGGTERVMWFLGKELVRKRHRVSFLVPPQSSCAFASIIPLQKNVPLARQIPPNVDIVHFHTTPASIEKITKPYLITMHGNKNTQEPFDLHTVFVSKSQAALYGSTSYVHNGLDWDAYAKPSFQSKKTYFHFLANAAWKVKNVVGAIHTIEKTKTEKLRVLGGVRFNFNMGIRLSFSMRVRFYGIVGGKKKDALLRHSKGLIFPVRWHEPFGLAIIESLYFGCPIFGTPYGALPEIVNDDVGFLSKSSSSIATRLASVEEFSRRRCHNYAVESFNAKKMTDSYLEKYELVLSGKHLNNTTPRLQKIQKEKLLDWHT